MTTTRVVLGRLDAIESELTTALAALQAAHPEVWRGRAAGVYQDRLDELVLAVRRLRAASEDARPLVVQAMATAARVGGAGQAVAV